MYKILLFLLLTGCTVGPVHITHEEGNLPKIHVVLPVEGCKFRPKASMEDQEVWLVCKKEV